MSLAEIKPASETMSANDIGDWQPAAPAPQQPASGQATDMRRVMNALSAIHPSRADTYADWLKIGRALRSLGDDYFSIFDGWSRQSAEYGQTREKWDSFGDNNRVKINTLYWYAIQDGWQPPKDLQPADDSEFTFMTAAELADTDFSVEYLIDEILVARQPLLLPGAAKSLKTSLALDMCVSLASKTKFLGRFDVLKKCRVAIMSGESGGGTLKETAERICDARGLKLRDLGANFMLSEDLPQCDSDTDLAKLGRSLKAMKPDVLFIDPAYLCLGGDEHGDVFKQGQLLRRLNAVFVEHGVTLILLHHNKKAAAKKMVPPALEDASMAGFAEFARQWILLGRRSEYYPGVHDLWMVTGGSAGHSGLFAVAVVEGLRKDEGGRRWEVHVVDHYEAIASQEDTAVQAVRELLEQHPDGLFKRGTDGIEGLTQLSKSKIDKALESDSFIYRKPEAGGKSRWFLAPQQA